MNDHHRGLSQPAAPAQIAAGPGTAPWLSTREQGEQFAVTAGRRIELEPD